MNTPVLERMLALNPEPGETPKQFIARSERLRQKWLKQEIKK